MATELKNKRVNVRPYHVEIDPSRNGDFTLSLFTTNDDHSVRTEYKIHFDHYWLAYLAELFWKVVACRRKALDETEKALRGSHD